MPYSASKFGVVGLSVAMDAELRSRGVRVSAVCPGMINTPIATSTPQRGGVTDAERSARIFGRFGAKPEVVAAAVERAWRQQRPIVTVPRWHVGPAWALMRLSPRLMSRLGGRIAAGQYARRQVP